MPTEPTPDRVTRLAPSPTGALHLGNALAFVVNWAMARKNNWRIHLRIEDLDAPRVKPGVIEQTIDTLRWLGIDWDSGPEIQSNDLQPYHEAMQGLAQARRIYPCSRSRAEIRDARAPNEGDTEIRFDPTLRPATFPHIFEDLGTNWRLIVEPGEIVFRDELLGEQPIDVDRNVGDFVVWTKGGVPSYQLAVVVDDDRAGVTDIVRGHDLVESTARQILLMRALGIGRTSAYWHLPLVRGADGRRLAKRHDDPRIEHYRSLGVDRERVIGLIAYWCGTQPDREPMSPAEFLGRFSCDTLPKDDPVFTREDDEWLTH
ncbi:MAG: hypothetical protein KC996_04290 [Phycisphaerales bacterium]|nr:hypothetical protein [Phycisphaerales bacterium]